MLLVGRHAPKPSASLALESLRKVADNSVNVNLGDVKDLAFVKMLFAKHKIGKNDIFTSS